MEEMTVQATIDQVEAVTVFVNRQLDALHCPVAVRIQIDIAIDELFSNIAKYAYPQEAGPATVRVDVTEEPRCVIITFMDHGKPYDPLSAAAPDLTSAAKERRIGGLGVYMVKNTMDDIAYEYRDDMNILTIRKRV